MKKTFTFMAIFLACILLAGCISIPFGDGEKLSIGLDGINIVADDAEAEGDGKEDPVTNQDDAKEEPADNEQEPSDETDQGEEVSGDDPTDETSNDPGDCEENYTDLTEHMPADFPMPDCASRPSVSVNADWIDSTYTVAGNWEDMYNYYKDFFESIGIKPGQHKNPDNNYGELSAKEGEYSITLRFSMHDEETVGVRVIQYFPVDEE